ncbi:DUF421 domain-containing protein [Shimazuella sp. AN120528]|uniref:DUF421 domain-containing protein n=1 Tax=Shimazuella soli TaxID=1892854 RepID=UPI001F10F53E|nr:DUF421 domain-containing protein [Shimazuella soli]MCH5584129.1 DUF421 domain-containing protein [Shimazuella soli]
MLSLILRTTFIYFFILLMMRLMGKREIGKLSVFDLIVSFMLADLSAMIIEDKKLEIINGVTPIVTIVALQILLSFIMLKNRSVRKLIDGEPTVIVQHGQILDRVMAKSRYNLDDLMMQLREKNISNISDVEYAILERSGKLSVFPKTEKTAVTKEDLKLKNLKAFHPPIPVVLEGKVLEDGLQQIGQNRFWLKKELRKKGYKDLSDIFYVSVNNEGKLFIDAKDKKH